MRPRSCGARSDSRQHSSGAHPNRPSPAFAQECGRSGAGVAAVISGGRNALFRHRSHRLHRQAPGQGLARPPRRHRALPAPAGERVEARGPVRVLGHPEPRRPLPCRAGARRPDRKEARRLRRRPEKAQGPRRPRLSPGRRLRPLGRRRVADRRQHRRHARGGRVRQGGRCRPPASRQLDCRRGPLRRRVSRGHVRGGRGPRASVLHDQAREREDRAQGVQGAVDGVPACARGRRLADRRDGQDRRPVLLLQADPAHAPAAAAVDALGGPRRRADQHRAGRLRRRRARPHQPPQDRSRQAVLSPRRPRRLPGRRRARHLQPCGARAEDESVRQRRAARLHSQGREEGTDGAGAGAAHQERGDEGPGPARRHAHLHQLSHPLRLPRGPRRAEGLGHRVPEAARLRLAPVGLLGAPPRSGAPCRPLAARHGRRQGGAGDRRLLGHRPGRGDASSPRPARSP